MNVEQFHERLKELYLPPEGRFTLVDVPEVSFMAIDGRGDPQGEDFAKAIKWLYSVVHLVKPLVKARMGRSFVEPPLESLFWTERPEDFVAGKRDRLHWRAMVVFIEEWIPKAALADAIAKAEQKLGPAPASLRVEALEEGKCVQTMHVGDPAAAAAVCERLYAEFLPANDLEPNGCYHEIYLNDPARTAPERRKMVIRQPVR